MIVLSTENAAHQAVSEFSEIQRLPTVRQRTGLGRSTIYRLMAVGDFPSSVQLTRRAIGWPKSAIDAWIAERPKAAH